MMGPKLHSVGTQIIARIGWQIPGTFAAVAAVSFVAGLGFDVGEYSEAFGRWVATSPVVLTNEPSHDDTERAECEADARRSEIEAMAPPGKKFPPNHPFRVLSPPVPRDHPSQPIFDRRAKAMMNWCRIYVAGVNSQFGGFEPLSGLIAGILDRKDAAPAKFEPDRVFAPGEPRTDVKRLVPALGNSDDEARAMVVGDFEALAGSSAWQPKNSGIGEWSLRFGLRITLGPTKAPTESRRTELDNLSIKINLL